ncbi:MAG: T9SS type A sorting domain-containing protein, partial [Bacteroidales bacterium]|nr:T9SS type A sorting domain-containing protein [Bacteroidales bacterium]
SPLEGANLNDALRVRVTADEIVLENHTGEYVKEMQAFSSTGRLLAVFPVNSAADARLAHRLPKGVVLLRAVSENGNTATFKVIIL